VERDFRGTYRRRGESNFGRRPKKRGKGSLLATVDQCPPKESVRKGRRKREVHCKEDLLVRKKNEEILQTPGPGGGKKKRPCPIRRADSRRKDSLPAKGASKKQTEEPRLERTFGSTPNISQGDH